MDTSLIEVHCGCEGKKLPPLDQEPMASSPIMAIYEQCALLFVELDGAERRWFLSSCGDVHHG